MEQIKFENILEMVNDKEMSLDEVGKSIGKSKSTVQRILAKEGYSFNKITRKYENETIKECSTWNNGLTETINGEEEEIKETLKNDNNKTINDELISRTYTIPKSLEKALKIKAAVEEKDVVDIVREALKAIIEDKYFNF